MPSTWGFCCVPGCNADSRKPVDKYPFMRGVVFFTFPLQAKEKRLRKRWISMVRREETWTPKKHTRICSRHFEGQMGPTEQHPVPTLFPWNSQTITRLTATVAKRETGRSADLSSGRPTTTHHGTLLFNLPVADFSMDTDICNENFNVSLLEEDTVYEDVAGEIDIEVNINKTRKPVVPLPLEVITPTCAIGDHTYSTSSKTYTTTSDIGCQTDVSAADLQKLYTEHSEMKSKLEDKPTLMKEIFVEKVLKNDASVQKYTGLPTLAIIMGLFGVLNKKTSYLNYWTSTSGRTKTNDVEGCERNRPGPKRKLDYFHEYILTLVKFRLGLSGFMMGDIFGVSETRVSQIFITWINFMYQTFHALIRWPSRSEINKNMPQIFKDKYPRTRVIIDCSEFFCERPRQPDAHHTHYSSYKHHTTHKVLLGISPSGAFTFVSSVWGGNVSDKYITRESGFIDLLEPGDDVMADRGFVIQDLLLPKGATLNAPPFTRKCNWGKGRRLNASEVVKTKNIAQLRIHVERAIQRLKQWKMLSYIMPISVKPYINQMVQLGAFFCNFQKPLVNDKK